jgi:hypothetical protein
VHFLFVGRGPNKDETLRQTKKRLRKDFEGKLDQAVTNWRRRRPEMVAVGEFRPAPISDCLPSAESRHSGERILLHLQFLAEKQAVSDPDVPELSAYSYREIATKLNRTPNGAKEALLRAARLIGLPRDQIRDAKSGRPRK